MLSPLIPQDKGRARAWIEEAVTGARAVLTEEEIRAEVDHVFEEFDWTATDRVCGMRTFGIGIPCHHPIDHPGPHSYEKADNGTEDTDGGQ